MASKIVPTRTSSRTKVTSTAVPTTTRTTRARAATKTTAPPPPTVPVKKTVPRKPLVDRENATEITPVTKAAAKVPSRKLQNLIMPDGDREPIMAYLRIRPHLGDDNSNPQPYLAPLSDTAVRMTDPHDPQSNPSRFRPSTIPPSSTYTFSHVFPPNTSQSEFFTKTTLPLVRDVLQGQNGLLFTYGVTNSGKTYTVQGGAKEGSAGILPRTLDVIFNSIEGLHGDGRFRPVRLHGVEPADPTDSRPPPVTPEPALAEVLGQHLDVSASDSDIDPTVLKVDRNYEHTIWISYAEVYNEKIYDLLASVRDGPSTNSDGAIPRTGGGKSLLLTRTALPIKPSPLSDNADSGTQGKYISGLRQFRVHSASQAKDLVKLGQLHRRVFGTLANRESSRSHGMVIIKVLRGHRGERDDPAALQISRLTLVDLAGSERTKHTHTTGDRLREAGNINKSLMVLGQCMEVMRSNQRKLAMSLSQDGVGKEGRMDTRDVKKGLAVVPFRHSKLTESLMDYFVGDGRAVMIVNVNPYDTGYDENSHVMKFAALAREVYITPAPAPVQRVLNGMTGPGKTHGTRIKELGPLTLKDPEIVPKPYTRKVTISTGGPGSGRRLKEAILEVVEEDEPTDELDDANSDDEPINPLVDALFDEVEDLRMQLFESEMRCAIIEAETREEVMREMEGRMRSMEAMYSKRLMSELEQNELKTDAKIDMLHQSGLFGSPVKKPQRRGASDDISEEEDVETSLMECDENEESASGEEFDFQSDGEMNRSMSLSPLAKKGKARANEALRTKVPAKVIREVRKFIPDQPLPPDDEYAELTETEQADDEASVAETAATESDNDSEYDDGGDGDEDEWVPSPLPISKPSKATETIAQRSESSSSNTRTLPSKALRAGTKHHLSRLEQEMDDLSLGHDDSVVILPVKKYKPHQSLSYIDASDSDDDVEDEAPTKKKKRQLGKKTIMTEEQIEKATFAVGKSNNGRHMRKS